jgi:hypothetical protein
MNTIQSSGAQRLFGHSVLPQGIFFNCGTWWWLLLMVKHVVSDNYKDWIVKMVFVLFCQTSFDISCQLHCCLNTHTHPTAHMSSSIATSIDKRYLYLYLWDKIRTLYNHNPFVYIAGQNHAYSQLLQSSLHHNSFEFLCVCVCVCVCVCECPRICLCDELILGYLIVSLIIKINTLKICCFFFPLWW